MISLYQSCLKKHQNNLVLFLHPLLRNKKQPNLGWFFYGTPDRIRTYDLLLRKQTLYPAELRVLIITLCGLAMAYAIAVPPRN